MVRRGPAEASLPHGHLTPGLCFLAFQAACLLSPHSDRPSHVSRLWVTPSQAPAGPLPHLWSCLASPPALGLGVRGTSQSPPDCPVYAEAQGDPCSSPAPAEPRGHWLVQ